MEERGATACMCLTWDLGGIDKGSQGSATLLLAKPTLFIESNSLAQAEELTRHQMKVTNLSRPLRPKWLFKRLAFISWAS